MNAIITINKNTRSIKIDKPNICPHCQKGIDPKIIKVIEDGFYNQTILYLALKCPICQQVFFAKYYIGSFSGLSVIDFHDFAPSEIIGGRALVKEFSKEINEISPDFVSLYNDAYGAEQYGLQGIIGISYRLAFEHLIKDYCVKTYNDQKDDILRKNLSQCINEYLDADIKDITKRAAWLGNDYAHYESKHPDMNVDDLKSIIDICVSRIETKIKENNYIKKIEKK